MPCFPDRRPSRGKRRWAVRLTYLFSVILTFALATNRLVGNVVVSASPAPHLQRTILTDLFTLYYGFIMLLAWTTSHEPSAAPSPTPLAVAWSIC